MGFRLGADYAPQAVAALTARLCCHSLPLPSESHYLKSKNEHHKGVRLSFGAANGIRTHDLVITNDVLYRLSYSSVLYKRIVL